MRALLFVLLPSTLLALDAPRNSVVVLGSATVDRPATSAKVSFRVTGKAEAAKDAVVKYKQKAEKMARALADAGVAKEDVSNKPPTIEGGQAEGNEALQVMRGGRQDTVTPLVDVSSTFEVKVAAKGDAIALVEAVAKVLDVVVEAGADNSASDPRQAYYGAVATGSGPAAPTVTFWAEDGASQRDETYAKALEDAKTRAGILSAKADRKIGKVVRIRELAETSGEEGPKASNVRALMAYWYGAAGLGNETEGSTVPTVSRTVRLEVEFALEP